jgi:hypothetical protein
MPKRDPPYEMKSGFLKGQLQILAPFCLSLNSGSFQLVWECLIITNEKSMASEQENFAMQTYSNEIILSVELSSGFFGAHAQCAPNGITTIQLDYGLNTISQLPTLSKIVPKLRSNSKNRSSLSILKLTGQFCTKFCNRLLKLYVSRTKKIAGFRLILAGKRLKFPCI